MDSLHQLLASRRDRHRLDLTVKHHVYDDHASVSAAPETDHYVRVNCGAYSWTADLNCAIALRDALRYYPQPVTINGATVYRAVFRNQPGIIKRRFRHNDLERHRQLQPTPLHGQPVDALLIDGVLYQISRDQPELRAATHYVLPDPEHRRAHYALPAHYSIHPNGRLNAAPQGRFSFEQGRPAYSPSPNEAAELQSKFRLRRRQGRRIIAADAKASAPPPRVPVESLSHDNAVWEIPQLDIHQSPSYGPYAGIPVIAANGSRPVVVDAAGRQSDAVANTVIRALHYAAQAPYVAVDAFRHRLRSPDRKLADITCAAVAITVAAPDQPRNYIFDPANPASYAELPRGNVDRITLHLKAEYPAGSAKSRGFSLPAAYCAAGPLGQEAFWRAPAAEPEPPDPETLGRIMALLHWPRQEHAPAIPHHYQALRTTHAVGLLHGPAAELEHHLNAFRPRSSHRPAAMTAGDFIYAPQQVRTPADRSAAEPNRMRDLAQVFTKA